MHQLPETGSMLWYQPLLARRTTEVPMSRTTSLRVFEDPGTSPLPHPVRAHLHDRMLAYMEQHAPEGAETPVRSRAARWAMLGGALLLVAGALTALALLAGPAAMGLGVVIIAAMCLVGAGPLVLAASERRAERERFEHRIERRLERLEARHEREPTGV